MRPILKKFNSEVVFINKNVSVYKMWLNFGPTNYIQILNTIFAIKIYHELEEKILQWKKQISEVQINECLFSKD